MRKQLIGSVDCLECFHIICLPRQWTGCIGWELCCCGLVELASRSSWWNRTTGTQATDQWPTCNKQTAMVNMIRWPKKRFSWWGAPCCFTYTHKRTDVRGISTNFVSPFLRETERERQRLRQREKRSYAVLAQTTEINRNVKHRILGSGTQKSPSVMLVRMDRESHLLLTCLDLFSACSMYLFRPPPNRALTVLLKDKSQ